MKKKSLILTLFLTVIVLNNFAQNAPHRFFLLKPNLRADTIAIIKNRVKKINLYIAEDHLGLFIKDSIPKMSLYGFWTIKSDANNINESTWNWSKDSINVFWDFNIEFSCIKSRKSKIIEINNHKSEIDIGKLKLIYYFNANNNIENTTLKYLSIEHSKYEDSFFIISKINYTYENGLLTEVNFINDDTFLTKNFCFLKFKISYEHFYE